jgi:hypothetical protein
MSVLLPITSSAWAGCSREELPKRNPKAGIGSKSYILFCMPRTELRPPNPVQTNVSSYFHLAHNLKNGFLVKPFCAGK